MVDVSLAEFSVTPKVIEVATGGMLMVTNKGTMPHNLAIEGQNLRTAMLNVGQEADINLGNLPPGDYTVFCEVPGHREAGMVAQLKVVAAGGSAGAPAAGAGTTGGGAATAAMTPEHMDELMAQRTKAFPATTAGTGAQALAPKVLADGTKQFDITTKI